ncbi:hypothetical protein [Flavobacterium sp. C4GT6]|uniref:hypothetical protein n=1 Tax=Flavobacterium sp. C4GT6 TaxID=3103818 RepID=UPI002ED29D74
MKDRNLEQQLADKLGNRSITPSAKAWDRIANNRQQGKTQKKKKKMFAYYAAAAVFFLLASGYVFLMQNKTDVIITEPQVVDGGEVATPVLPSEEAVVSKSVEIKETEAVAYKKPEVLVKKHSVEVVAEKQEMASVGNKEVVIKKKQPKFNLHVEPIEALVSIEEDEFYEQETDMLLEEAIKDVAANKYLSNTTNDTALLKEVEAEMDEYYREKAMSIFSLKHKTIRIAVKDKQ